MKANKVLLFSPILHPDIGGPAVQGSYLVEMFIKSGYDVTAVKYKKNPLEPEREKYKTLYLNFSANPRNYVRIVRWIFAPAIAVFILLKERPTVYISNTVSFQGMLTGAIAKLFSIPTIMKFTGDWVFESTKGDKESEVDYSKIYQRDALSRFLFKVERFLLGKFDLIWVISEYRKTNVMALGIDSSKIWIQRNFHKLPTIKHEKTYSDEILIITASRIVEHKRIDQLLKSLGKFTDKKWKLIVCGDGPNLIEVKNLAKSLGIERNVAFTGTVSRELLFELMERSDLYVSWSAEEGAPNVFIEALHFGLPVISANVGGVSEMIEDGFNGTLLDPNDPSLIPNAINSFFNFEKLVEFSRNAVHSSNLYNFDLNSASFMSKVRELERP